MSPVIFYYQEDVKDIQRVWHPIIMDLPFAINLSNLSVYMSRISAKDECAFLRHVVAQMASPINLLKMIALALATGETGEAHPNGFLRMPLLRCGRGSERMYELRLHVWETLPNFLNKTNNTKTKEFIEDIHDHRVAFATHCITGGYDNILYNVVDSSHPGQEEGVYAMTARKCYDENGSHFVLERAANRPIAQHSMCRFSRNATYALPDNILHRVSNLRPGTITLTLRGVDRGKATTRLWTANPDVTIKDATPLSVRESSLVYAQLIRLLF